MDKNLEREPTKTIVIITPYEDSVDSYINARRDVAIERPKECPECGGKDIIFWSGYWRYAVVGENAKRLFVHRTRCKSCKKTHSILPWFILPGRAHLAETVGHCLWRKIVNNQSVRSLAKELRVSHSTVRGWIRRFLTQAQNIYERCLFLIHSAGAHPPPVEGVKTGALLFLFKLFLATRFSSEHELFFNYVSLLTKGRFLTNTTSPLRIRPYS